MRKSTQPKKAVTGNKQKYLAYREAFARIKESHENGFYLEAIAIEESIITDRIISYLKRPNAPSQLKKGKHGGYPSFSNLIKILDKDVGRPIEVKKYNDLCSSLNIWRADRNNAIHCLVASEPGTPSQQVDDFLMKAKKCATEGAKLARAICDWHKAQKS